jgi:hypothetical protein
LTCGDKAFRSGPEFIETILRERRSDSFAESRPNDLDDRIRRIRGVGSVMKIDHIEF